MKLYWWIGIGGLVVVLGVVGIWSWIKYKEYQSIPLQSTEQAELMVEPTKTSEILKSTVTVGLIEDKARVTQVGVINGVKIISITPVKAQGKEGIIDGVDMVVAYGIDGEEKQITLQALYGMNDYRTQKTGQYMPISKLSLSAGEVVNVAVMYVRQNVSDKAIKTTLECKKYINIEDKCRQYEQIGFGSVVINDLVSYIDSMINSESPLHITAKDMMIVGII